MAIVQDPSEALAPSMPLSAIEHVQVDAVRPVEEIAALLVELATVDAAQCPSGNGAGAREPRTRASRGCSARRSCPGTRRA